VTPRAACRAASNAASKRSIASTRLDEQSEAAHLAAADVTLDENTLARIDEIERPGAAAGEALL
jgi:hypothetical protein